MAQRNPSPPKQAHPAGWVIHTEGVRLPGHALLLSPGVELTANLPGRKRRARLSFRRHVTNAAGATWVEAWDGKATRSLPESAVVTVHRSRKLHGA